MRKTEGEREGKLLRYGKGVLTGGAAALLISAAVLLLASLGMARGLVDAGLREQVAVAACVIGSFGGGSVAVRSCRDRSLLAGMAVGAVLFLAQVALGLLLTESASLENGGLGMLLGDLCGGAVAGLLGGRGKGRTPSKGKRRR